MDNFSVYQKRFYLNNNNNDLSMTRYYLENCYNSYIDLKKQIKIYKYIINNIGIVDKGILDLYSSYCNTLSFEDKLRDLENCLEVKEEELIVWKLLLDHKEKEEEFIKYINEENINVEYN